ncbi:MAG TPA: crosslink repair DNA glycosylase YcaQ family protein [Anaerolineales bacterium]|nr:crosslink repair DNA glycosylase YcaQ family protein [Anaerolineales bacterium]HNN12120.1 crosslink repair DNA glycosylase YcaQ family protein [Anaerolineales bacterium]HNO31035.1 crosslink repair DNA glycosylase YcaQ family protein [Anaerolineales bacterium]
MTDLTISRRTYRRFLLASQGLWPGRRYRGLSGTESALRQMQALQLDPLVMVARSQDIAMYGRVLDYKPDLLYKMAYGKRKAFDYGGWLMMYPMHEFPYWRLHMQRRAEQGLRWEHFAHPPRELVKFVLGELRDKGPLGNRDIEGDAVKAWSYRGRKETSITLFYLWLTGEVMISNRKGFDRIYDLRERVLPSEFDHAVPMDEAEDFLGKKIIAFLGLARESTWRTGWGDYIHRKVTAHDGKQRIEQLIEQGEVSRVRVEGFKENFLILNSDLPHLLELEAGRIPKVWKPKGSTTEEEVTLLAPLEIVSARGRAKRVFDFDYVWEVYKPAHQRKWGYYTLPVLYGDDLVARLDPKHDRATNTLQILGFWLEEDTVVDAAFATALGRGLARFAKVIGASKVDIGAMQPARLRTQARKAISSVLDET